MSPLRSSSVRFSPWCITAIALLVSVSNAVAAKKPAASLHDLAIHDPGADSGKPPTVFKEKDGKVVVELSQATHVHRYYYSGDKEVQARTIRGGPTRVIARHPQTGEHIETQVMLPAGAPIVVYTKQCITYVFPDQSVRLKFQCHPLDTRVVVVNHQIGRHFSLRARRIASKAKSVHAGTKKQTHKILHESALVQSAKDTSKGAGKLFSGAASTFDSISSQLVDGAKSALGLIPGMSALRSMGDDASQKGYENDMRRAAERNARNAPSFLRTNQ